ncbi:MAG: helix-turn-helix transcriptional regulator [Clostridia bacterium]|nr:helix-turn-helix transcriptional regulator [Clostridia bacterium]
MPNEKKIRARIVEQGLTIGEIALKMEISAYTLGKKISGKAKMTLDEAWLLMSILNIPDSEFILYFFCHQVA